MDYTKLEHRDVDGFTDNGVRILPRGKLQTERMTEGVMYLVKEVPEGHPFVVGDIFSVDHNFYYDKKNKTMCGYEHLRATAYRKKGDSINNCCLYFGSLAELDEFLGTFTYEADVARAKQLLAKYKKAIAEVRRDYGIHEEDTSPWTRCNFQATDTGIAMCNGDHERGDKCSFEQLTHEKTLDIIEQLVQEVLGQRGRLQLLEIANKAANKAIASQADEFSAILARMTPKGEGGKLDSLTNSGELQLFD